MEYLRGSSFEQGPSLSPPIQFNELNDHIYELYKPARQPVMEILFFHGLQFGNSGNAYWTTWRCGDASHPNLVWPATWLAEKFPNAHIFSIAYDASMRKTNKGGRLELHNLAENLLHAIGWARIGQGHLRPVILVGHCFGGLVIKQLCVKAHQIFCLGRESRKKIEGIKRFLNNMGGVFFYGTPHRGSHLVNNAIYFLNGPLLEYVMSLSASSAILEEEFDAVSKKYKTWPTASLGEELPTSWGPFQGVVVPEGSARYGDFCTVATDHISICKPTKKTSNSFQHLISFISGVAPKGEERFDNIQHIPKAAVGLDSQLDNVREKLLEYTRVGIVGMGGTGKTTLAKAVFNKLGPTFEYTCFVPDVKLIKGDATDLKKEMWKHMHCDGKSVAHREDAWFELRGKQLLLVLDDVAQDRDVEILSIIASHTTLEMRCIVTSPNVELLNRSDDMHIHPMSFLSESDARQLFVSYAFPYESTELDMWEIHVNSVLKKCGGLPLTIEILGKYLKSKENPVIWEQVLEALEKAEAIINLDERLWVKLRVSYNALGEKERQMFLDATTMFSGNTGIWPSWTLREAKAGWRVTHGMEQILWKNLVNMSLVYDVKEDEPIKVHEQLQQLGRKIALESNKDGKCRVWDQENKMALALLQSTKDDHYFDDKEIYSFVLRRDDKKGHFPKNLGHVVKISRSCIGKLEKVQYLDLEVRDLIVDHEDEETEPFPVLRDLVLLRSPGLQFGRRLLFDPALLPRLAVLKLSGEFYLQFLPSSFGQLSELKILEIADAWELEILPDEFGNLFKLERLTFNCCSRLTTLPKTFGGLTSLQHLEFYSACQLHTLPESFGQLSALRHIKFHECEKLHTLSEHFGQLAGLEHLEFHRCKSLDTIPESFGQLAKLKHLQFHHCKSLVTLPEAFGRLSPLEHLEFHSCKNLDTMPQSFGLLCALKHLEFHDCKSLRALPPSFGHLPGLEHLEMVRCNSLHTLPDSFGQLAKLQVLRIEECRKIETLPFSARQLGALRHLIIDFTAVTSIPDFPSLKILELGILPFLQRFPPWREKGLAESRKILHIRDGQFSLQEESNLNCYEQEELRNWLHGIAMDRVEALDYPGAVAVTSDFGLETLEPGRRGFILQERGIIKRLMGDLDGALEDLTIALILSRANPYSDWPEHSTDKCLKHRGFVRYLKGDEQGAVDDANETLKIRPWKVGKVTPSKPNLGEESITYLNFKFAGRRESQDHEERLLSSHFRAMKKVQASDFRGALADFDVIDARMLAPERQAFFWQERGILKRLVDDLEGSLADLTDALEISFRYGRDDYRCRKHRGFVKYLKEDYEGARADAERALAIGAPADLRRTIKAPSYLRRSFGMRGKKLDDYKAEPEHPDRTEDLGHMGCLGEDSVIFSGFKLER